MTGFVVQGPQIIWYESYCTAIKSLTGKIAKLQWLIYDNKNLCLN